VARSLHGQLLVELELFGRKPSGGFDGFDLAAERRSLRVRLAHLRLQRAYLFIERPAARGELFTLARQVLTGARPGGKLRVEIEVPGERGLGQNRACRTRSAIS
jgi:hypothetical protein